MMIEENITVARWGFASMLVASSLLAAAFLCWLHKHDIHLSESILRFLRRPIGEVLIVLVCVGGLVQHGATKGFFGSPRMMAPREMQTELASEPDTVGSAAGIFPAYTNAVTNVCATGIMPTESSVFLRAHWPWNLHPAPTGIEVYAAPQLTTNQWVGVGTAPVIGSDNSAVIELPYSVLPDGWTSSMFFMLGLNIDTDQDGLSDSFERIISKTDPNLADTDGDGMPDGWEYSNGLNPRSEPTDDEANADSDGDGLVNLDECRCGTDPQKADSDSDGIDDVGELGRVCQAEDFQWYDTVGGSSVIVWGNQSSIDDAVWTVDLYRSAFICGTEYDRATIDSNGLVYLVPVGGDSITQYKRSNYSLPYNGLGPGHLVVAAYWDDLQLYRDRSAEIRVASIASNGCTVVEFAHERLCGSNSASEDLTFQVVIPGGTNNEIRVNYLTATDGINGSGATIGIMDSTARNYQNTNQWYAIQWSNNRSSAISPNLSLVYEIGTGTDPCERDTDGDGLDDWLEIFGSKTDPCIPDTDGDGLTDEDEMERRTDPSDYDTDGDGMPDGWEVANGLDPLLTNAGLDSDGDGLYDLEEFKGGTGPFDDDSDDDGLKDGEECGFVRIDSSRLPEFDLVDGTNLLDPTQTYDDQRFLLNLPFPISFDGHKSTNVLISVNGFVWLLTDEGTVPTASDYGNNDLSSERSSYHCFIGAYWDDLKAYAGRNAQISMSDVTVESRRYCVIRYVNLGLNAGGSSAENLGSFQIVIPQLEPNVVYVNYLNLSGTFNGSGATIGAQSPRKNVNFAVAYNRTNSVTNGMTIAYCFGAGTSATLADTDHDDLDDALELQIGTNPVKPDTDGDGMPDGWERQYGLNPLSAEGIDGAWGDFDDDGLLNISEYELMTDPTNRDTDDDDLIDGQEAGAVQMTNTPGWMAFADSVGRDITADFANADRALVNYPLGTPLRIQGVMVTNVIVDLNGVLYFPRRGYGSDISSQDSGSLRSAVYTNALVVAPYWRDLYLTQQNPVPRISVHETTWGTNTAFVLQYENVCPYSNRSRTSTTNALSFQVVVPDDASNVVYVTYKDVLGSDMDGRSASVGVQGFGGRWAHILEVDSSFGSPPNESLLVTLTYPGNITNGFGMAFTLGFGTDPLSKDTDGDGCDDGMEAGMGTSPMMPDSDGDGLLDGWEQSHGLDPTNPNGDDGAAGDPDGDGASNSDEQRNGADPHNSDTDGDGIDDGDEIEQGTDPADRADTLPVQWVTVTGDLPEGVVAQESQTVTIPSGRMCLVCVFVYSEEYPEWTSQASRYNDRLTWDVHATGNATLSNTIFVNNEDISWDNSDGCSVYGYEPVVLKDKAIYVAGSTDLLVSVNLAAMNVSDDILPSTVMVGFFPLNVVQANMPSATGGAGTTDAGTSYVRVCVPTNGTAYITAQPTAPQLTAQFKGLPEWINVSWGGTLRTERVERHACDNKTLKSCTLAGTAPYNITDALQNTIVGGKCVLGVSVGGQSASYPFSIRGKNPLDATACTYINSQVTVDFQAYAWMIAKHESKSGNRVYNQFNPSGNMKELPNKTGGNDRWGWGIAQIDKGEDGDSTAEVYDWHENVSSMNVKLQEALATYNRFVGYFRSMYANNPNVHWVEPDEATTTIDNYVVSAKMWSVLTFYNGAGGCPQRMLDGVMRRTPIEFDPITGRWIFYSNSQNYVTVTVSDRNAIESE